MDIYVGNLPYSATEEEVSGLFAAYGPVERVKIITDRETGRSKDLRLSRSVTNRKSTLPSRPSTARSSKAAPCG